MGHALTAAICILNSKYVHSSLAPWYLAAGVDAYCKNGITAEIIEGTVNENLETVAKRIIARNPAVIGFSCYIWNIAATKQLARLVKRESNAIIVFGGPEVSFNAEDILQNEPDVQYVISGEGEKPFALLLNAIYDAEEALHIPGVCYWNGEKTVISPPYTSEEDPVRPYTKKYLKR